MTETTSPDSIASLEDRARALTQAFEEHELVPSGYFEEFSKKVEEDFVHTNGATVVARAWSDPAYAAQLFQDGKRSIEELGFALPGQQRLLVALRNTPTVHNVIVCTLCSCTAFTLLGVAPKWYKDLEYRARIVRQARTVLGEMGLHLPDGVEIRVWDTTADTRYIVIPHRPEATAGWSEEQLRAIVTKESMIGVTRLEQPYAATLAVSPDTKE